MPPFPRAAARPFRLGGAARISIRRAAISTSWSSSSPERPSALSLTTFFGPRGVAGGSCSAGRVDSGRRRGAIRNPFFRRRASEARARSRSLRREAKSLLWDVARSGRSRSPTCYGGQERSRIIDSDPVLRARSGAPTSRFSARLWLSSLKRRRDGQQRSFGELRRIIGLSATSWSTATPMWIDRAAFGGPCRERCCRQLARYREATCLAGQ